MIPQIPRYFIEKFSNENDIILDPFCGCGTTLLEGLLCKRNTVGIDLNPLAVLISKVKTQQQNLDDLKEVIGIVKNGLKEAQEAYVDFPNIDYWFSKEAKTDLAKIKFVIEEGKQDFSEASLNFLLVSFSSIIRKSSLADWRMAKTYKSHDVLRRIKNGWKPYPIKLFEEALQKNLERLTLLSIKLQDSHNTAIAIHGNVKDTAELLQKNNFGKIDCIITSPPYINAQDYFRSYKLELWWLGLATAKEVIDFNKKSLGTEYVPPINRRNFPKSDNLELQTALSKIWVEGKLIRQKKANIVSQYFSNMSAIFQIFNQQLRSGGHLCLVTGNNTICEVNIPTYSILSDIAKEQGFIPVENGKDNIKYRTLAPDRKHKGGIIKEEWVSVFKKE